jgi:hypothetical protein
MKAGDIVRHKARAEWGIGVIVEISAKTLDVNFEGRGRRRLALAFAAPLLEHVLASTVAADSALLDPVRWLELELPPEDRTGTRTARGDHPCEHCGRPLRRSQYSGDGFQKSCPRCSANDGAQHVYYVTPDAFGTSEKRENDKTTSGVQSHCYVCREIDRPYPLTRCSAVEQP